MPSVQTQGSRWVNFSIVCVALECPTMCKGRVGRSAVLCVEQVMNDWAVI